MGEDKKSRNWLLYLDFFGLNFSFLINGQVKERNYIGVILTIFYLFTIISLFLGFGVDLYQRKKPNISFNSEKSSFNDFKFSNENFTYAYRVETSEGHFFKDDSILYPTVIYGSVKIINGSWTTEEIKILPNNKCSNLPNYEEKEKYYNISLKEWYCIDFENMTLGGGWDGNFVKAFSINVYQCQNSTENNSTCATQDKFEKSFYSSNGLVTSNFFFSDLTLYAQPQLNNLEKPLSSYLVNNYQMLNLEFTKRKIQNFKTTKVLDDKGWLFPNIFNHEIITTENFFYDFTMKGKWEHNILSNVYLYFGNRLDSYNRSYTKIQQVLAEIGGFEKLIYNIFFVIYFCFSSIYRNLIIINRIPFNEDNPFSPKKELNKRENFSSMMINPTEVLKIEIESKLKNKNKNITFINYLCYKCGKRKYSRSQIVPTLDNMKLYENFYIKKMDILNYFKLHKEMSILKNILLTSNHRKILKLIYPKLHKPLEKNDDNLEKSQDPLTIVNRELKFSDDISKNLYQHLESKLQTGLFREFS